MNSILTSIKPKYVMKILDGDKTIEVRKTAPKDWVDYLSGKIDKKPEPKTVYIYCTKDGNEFLTTDAFQYFALSKKAWTAKRNFYYDFNGKIVASFTLKKVEECVNPFFPKGTFATKTVTYESLLDQSCLNAEQLDGYLGKGKRGYAWHISDLVIFDKPKELTDFVKSGITSYETVKKFASSMGRDYPKKRYIERCKQYGYLITKAPQSWCYCEEVLE